MQFALYLLANIGIIFIISKSSSAFYFSLALFFTAVAAGSSRLLCHFVGTFMSNGADFYGKWRGLLCQKSGTFKIKVRAV